MKSAAKRKPRRPSVPGEIPDSSAQAYVFKLFVSGSTDKSSKAIDNIKRICEAHFPGQYQLEVVDVYQQPQLASGEQIIAVPTLVKKAPGRVKKILGSIGDTPDFIRKLK